MTIAARVNARKIDVKSSFGSWDWKYIIPPDKALGEQSSIPNSKACWIIFESSVSYVPLNYPLHVYYNSFSSPLQLTNIWASLKVLLTAKMIPF